MKYILFLTVYLAGCAVSTEQLIAEANECVAHAPGIVGKPTQAQRDSCWVPVNERLEIESKMEAKRAKERAGSCDRGYVMWCSRDSCGCVSNTEMREALKRFGY